MKIIIIGEPGVGKTSLVKRFVSGQFSTDYRASIGTNIFIKKFKLDSHDISIHLWDIAGQEKWIRMRHSYYSGSHGALVVGDLTREDTFKQITSFWIPDLKENCGKIPIILLANKSDLKSELKKEFITEIGKKVESDSILITSAKRGENVEDAFHLIAKTIINTKA